MQKSGKSINANMGEVLSFMGMKVIMLIVKLPSYNLNWSAETRPCCHCHTSKLLASVK